MPTQQHRIFFSTFPSPPLPSPHLSHFFFFFFSQLPPSTTLPTASLYCNPALSTTSPTVPKFLHLSLHPQLPSLPPSPRAATSPLLVLVS